MVELPLELKEALTESQSRDQRIVVMTCGISGSGKSTLAKSIKSDHPNFVRLSIDVYVHEHHGIFGVDYPKERNEEFQDEAIAALEKEFKQILTEGKKDVVLDFSFYNREYRDEWRSMVSTHGRKNGGHEVRIIVVHFDATEEVLWERVQTRSRGVKDADSAAEISRELLASYVKGFEKPTSEEEGDFIIIKVE